MPSIDYIITSSDHTWNDFLMVSTNYTKKDFPDNLSNMTSDSIYVATVISPT